MWRAAALRQSVDPIPMNGTSCHQQKKRRRMEMKAVHVIVSGRVHGVGFRAWTAEEANSLRVTGWVRNLRDRTVEAVFCGAAAAVDEMLDRVKTGPLGAHVENVSTTDWDGTSFDTFAILSTQNA